MIMNGIQQPRICPECLLKNLTEGEQEINDEVWIEQIMSLPDGIEQMNRLLEDSK